MQREAEFSSPESFNSNLSGMFVLRLRMSSSIPGYNGYWVERTELPFLLRVGPQSGAVSNRLLYLPPLNSRGTQRLSSSRIPLLEACLHVLIVFESSETEPAKEDVPGI